MPPETKKPSTENQGSEAGSLCIVAWSEVDWRHDPGSKASINLRNATSTVAGVSAVDDAAHAEAC